MKSEKELAEDAGDSTDKQNERSVLSGTAKGDSGFCSSFKSKRYRDKLRSEIKSLDSLLPVDRTTLHRKLDSQTVFRLVISFFRTKVFFKAIGFTNDVLDEEESGGGSNKVQVPEETSTENDDLSELQDLLKGDNLIQALDGFLIVAMADGTIIYVSENVLQYLGFNQIDLMHRCLYSIVHPDDHFDVRDVFEQTIPDGALCDLPTGSFCEPTPQARYESEAVSFLCRMRCFNGTTAGYLKMHCSGRLQVLPEAVRTTKYPGQIIFAFCRPFMISGQDQDYDVKQNVFWTKHDMDLTFKQLDKKAADVIGYATDDVDGKSFYEYIHPEDITTCCVCHKALMESSDIQTMYFRLQTKSGSWVWLHSRGKVVTKNSKKYSIVFSHYPVREDDSSYIQQEIVLRQRYSINELFYLRQNNFHLDIPTSSDSMFEMISQQVCAKKAGSRSVPLTANVYMDEFVTSQGSCPSSWHMMSDRHSPVLPSTHVAHKISVREKQLHFQDFKKRQLEQSYRKRKVFHRNPVGQTEGHFADGRFSVLQGMAAEGTLFPGQFQQRPNHLSQAESSSRSPYRCPYPVSSETHPCYPESYVTPELSPESMMDLVQADNNHSDAALCQPQPFHNSPNLSAPYCMPPSPPPSPQRHFNHQQCLAQDRTVHVRNIFTHHPSGGYTWVQDQTYHVRSHGNKNVKHAGGHCLASDDVPFQNPLCASTRSTRSKRPRCDYRSSEQCYVNPQQTCNTWSNGGNLEDPKDKRHVNNHGCRPWMNVVTWDSPDIYSCAVASGCCEPGDKTPSCFDPAFHMKIVDEPVGNLSKSDLDLPSIGSFLEYLNDI